MNTFADFQVAASDIAFDEQFLRDLADVEVVLVGGGEVVFSGR
jgi:hypothetical protein